MSIPNLQVLERFETWKSFNESLLPFMSFKYASNPNAEFFQNRKNEHDQAFKNLTNLEKDAKNETCKRQLELKRLNKIENKLLPWFDKQEHNYKIRMYIFIRKKIKKMKYKYLNGCIAFLKEKVILASQMKTLFSKQIAPKECLVSIFPEFFSLEYDQKLLLKISALQNLKTKMYNEINIFPKPLWINNFPQFFKDMIEEGKKKIDKELFYLMVSQLILMEINLPSIIKMLFKFQKTHGQCYFSHHQKKCLKFL